MNLFQLSTVFAAALIATAAGAATAPASSSADRALTQGVSQGTIVAREAESGDDRRGRGRGKDNGGRVSEEVLGTQIARETESGDDRRGRGRGKDDKSRA